MEEGRSDLFMFNLKHIKHMEFPWSEKRRLRRMQKIADAFVGKAIVDSRPDGKWKSHSCDFHIYDCSTRNWGN